MWRPARRQVARADGVRWAGSGLVPRSGLRGRPGASATAAGCAVVGGERDRRALRGSPVGLRRTFGAPGTCAPVGRRLPRNRFGPATRDSRAIRSRSSLGGLGRNLPTARPATPPRSPGLAARRAPLAGLATDRRADRVTPPRGPGLDLAGRWRHPQLLTRPEALLGEPWVHRPEPRLRDAEVVGDAVQVVAGTHGVDPALRGVRTGDQERIAVRCRRRARGARRRSARLGRRCR